jgi:CRP-like cAMP-binding protein
MTITPRTRKEILAGHFLLRHLTQEELARLADKTSLRDYNAGAIIFQKGDEDGSMLAVLNGRVKICSYAIDGKELVLNFIDEGGLFGEIAVLDGLPRSATAVALEDTRLLVLDRVNVMPVLTAHPEIVTHMIEVLCQRLRSTSEALEDAVLRDGPSRVARGLLRLAAAFGRQHKSGVLIGVHLSQQQIANLIGMSRERTNMHIVEWTRRGYLKSEDGYIVIADHNALESLAEALY